MDLCNAQMENGQPCGCRITRMELLQLKLQSCTDCGHRCGSHGAQIPQPRSPEPQKEASTTDSAPTTICGIRVAEAFKLAAELSCRSALEKFAHHSARFHDLNVKTCSVKLNNSKVSITSKLTHFEYCGELPREADHILDKQSEAELPSSVQPPRSGNLQDLFNSLSQRIHNSQILRTMEGKAVVTSDMPAVEKRLLVRTLMSLGEDVVIFDGRCIRPPRDDEINTPPKVVTDAAAKTSETPETPLSPPKRLKRQ